MTAPGPWQRPPDKPPRRGRRVWPWLVAAGLVVAGAVLALVGAFPERIEDEGSQLYLVRRLGLLVILLTALVVHWRASPGKALRHALIWIAIGAGLLLAYSLRHDAADLGDRLLAELLPHRGATDGDTLTLNARKDGHFVVEAKVDGTPVRFLVDTGASSLVLRPRDAERLGFDPAELRYDRVFNTANGTVRGAPVRLNEVRIGPIVLRDVRASVNQAPMDTSLLGMSFLGRLSRYTVTGDRMVLEP